MKYLGNILFNMVIYLINEEAFDLKTKTLISCNSECYFKNLMGSPCVVQYTNVVVHN